MRKGLKRGLQVFGVVLALLVLAFGAIGYSAFGGTSAIVDGATPAPDVRIVKDGFVDVGVVDVGGGKVLLIDGGNDPKATAIQAELSRRSIGNDAVVAFFLTHGHKDHLAGCAAFPNAAVYALEADVALAEGREGGHGALTRWFPFAPTGIKVRRALHDGEVVEVGNKKVRVFAVPGHTAGSAAYLVGGVLFLGDSAGMTRDGALAGAVRPFSDDVAQNHASLRALSTRLQADKGAVTAIVPAHTGSGTFAALEAFAP